jgi:transcriptional regulator GlxA family with amidase domain
MIHVSLLATPEAGSSLLGAMELLSTVGVAWDSLVEGRKPRPLFRTQIVSESGEPLSCFNRWTVQPDASIAAVPHTDVIFVPSLWLEPDESFAGRHPALRDWIVQRYRDGALVCAACTGTILLAETGLLDGEVATTHWAYVEHMRRHYPGISLQPDKILVEAGDERRLITSGSHATWYDLLLYVISRTAGRDAALQTAKFFLLQWHSDGQSPYMTFREPLDHGDAVVREAQQWLRNNYSQPNPVSELESRAGMPARSFNRRFKQATGMTPMSYIQQLRIDRAKALLEKSELAVDTVSWKIGYEDVAFFNRLFKRITGLTPGVYRRKFRIPFATGA